MPVHLTQSELSADSELKRLRQLVNEAQQRSDAAMRRIRDISRAIAKHLEQRQLGDLTFPLDRLSAESDEAGHLFDAAVHERAELLDRIAAQRALILGDWKSDEGRAGPITLVRHEDQKLIATEADSTGHQDMVPR